MFECVEQLQVVHFPSCKHQTGMRWKNRKTFAFDTEPENDECAVCEQEEEEEDEAKKHFLCKHLQLKRTHSCRCPSRTLRLQCNFVRCKNKLVYDIVSYTVIYDLRVLSLSPSLFSFISLFVCTTTFLHQKYLVRIFNANKSKLWFYS